MQSLPFFSMSPSLQRFAISKSFSPFTPVRLSTLSKSFCASGWKLESVMKMPREPFSAQTAP